MSSDQSSLLAIAAHRPAMAGYYPIVEVELDELIFWSMPPSLSAQVFSQMQMPVVENWHLGYTWQWGKDGELASWNRYLIDVETMTQMNVDTHCERALRVVWVQQ